MQNQRKKLLKPRWDKKEFDQSKKIIRSFSYAPRWNRKREIDKALQRKVGRSLQGFRKARFRLEGNASYADLFDEDETLEEETNNNIIEPESQEVKEILEENKRLKIQIKKLTYGERIPLHKFDGDWIRFGILSDTHLGSHYAHLDLLDMAYQFYEKEGIDKVYHSGDLCDGEGIYRSQVYEISHHGVDAQLDFCQEIYPQTIDTYFVTGNHDLSFWNRAGIDIGDLIEARMPKMHYLGQDWADVVLQDEEGYKATLRLLHPGKGCSYALSYQPQKYIEALYGGEKPNFLAIGHYHKSEYLFYRNIHCLQSGTIQKQSPFMARRNLAAMTGFWLVELMLDEIGITRCRVEFIPQYD